MATVSCGVPRPLPTPFHALNEQTSTPARPPQSLRDSCDNCYRAKIKCSKTKPDCQRCMHRGLQCVYLPSRRRGRRKATAARSESPNPTSQASVASKSTPGLDNDMIDSLPALTDCSMPGSPFGAFDDASLSSADFLASETCDSPFWNGQTLFPDSSFCEEPMSPIASSVELNHVAPRSIDLRKPHRHFAPESFLLRLDSRHCDCESRCLEALSLLSRSSWCSLSSDSITTLHTRAIDQCSRTLGCMLCLSQAENSAHLVLVLGTLLSKVIASLKASIEELSAEADTDFMLDTSFPTTPGSSFDLFSERPLHLNTLFPSIQRLQPLLGRFHSLCDRVSASVAGSEVDGQPAELFQTLPEYLEDDFLHMTGQFQERSRRWVP